MPLILFGFGLVGLLAAMSSASRPGGYIGGDVDKAGTYFTFGEFDAEEAPESVRSNVRALVANVLDPLRGALGRQLRITSGYRTPEHNAAIGGSATSDHMTGEAADFQTVDGSVSPAQIAGWIVRLGLPFDQLITYATTGHVHVSFRRNGNRGQQLYKDATGKYVGRVYG